MTDADRETLPSRARKLGGLAAILVVLAGLAWWAAIGKTSAGPTDSVAPLPGGSLADLPAGEAGSRTQRPARLADAEAGDESTGPAQLAERLPTDQVRVLSLRVVRKADKSPLRDGVKVILTTGPDPGAEVLDARTADDDGLCQFELPRKQVTTETGFLIVWQPVTFVPHGDAHSKVFANQVAQAWVAVDSLKPADGASATVVELDTGCRLTVLVVDDAGTSVAKAEVRMESGGTNAMTDAAGLAVLQDVPRGSGMVECHKRGFLDGTAVVEVGTDDLARTVTVVMHGESLPR